MKKRSFVLGLSGLVALFSFLSIGYADTLNNVPPLKDTYINQGSPDSSYGTLSTILLTTNPDSTNTSLLLQWDLTAIPTTATVTGVVITFLKTGSDIYEDAIGLRLETPNADWVESCTWNQVNSGGLTLVGFNELNPLLSSPYVSSVNGTAIIEAVQGWVSNPLSNHGLLITQFIDMYQYISFRSKEGGGGPTISVTYTIPPILSVTPQDDLHSAGRLGGPYSPLSIDYTLQNTGAGTLHWTVTPSWPNAPFPFTVSSPAGSLELGQSTIVTVSVNESYPFEDGTNVADTIYFYNADNGLGSTSRIAEITVSDLVFCADFSDGTSQGWGFRDGSGLTTDLAHGDSYSIRVFDPAGYGDAAECYRVFTPVAKGKAEFWMNMPSTSTAPVQVYLSDEAGWQANPDHRFLVAFNLDGTVKYYHNGGYADFSGSPTFAFDVWTKITLTWDSGANELYLRINDEGFGIGFETNPGGDIDQIVFQKDGLDKTGIFAYFDDICVWYDDNPIPPPQKDDFVGTWDGQGVYYRNSDTGGWVKMASPATMIAAGDMDGDGTDDLIGLWPAQGGIWVKYSSTGAWARLSSTAVHIGAGDMNGDGREDLLGTWDGQGVYYRDSMTGAWVKMASPATLITAGDIDGDGTGDLVGIWPSQGGAWVKSSTTGAWARISSTALDITTGKMRAASGSGTAQQSFLELPMPMGGYEEGPASDLNRRDLSDKGPGGLNFVFKEQKNLIPWEEGHGLRLHSPSPGERGFRFTEEKGQYPGEKKEPERKRVHKITV